MKNWKCYCLLPVLLLFGMFVNAQSSEDKRMKIELTVKHGTETIVSTLSSSTVAYTRQDYAVDSSSLPIRNFVLSVNFDKSGIQTLRAFIKNKNGVDGQITITDTYGKLPSRKLEFKSAIMDGYSEQFASEYSSMYFNMRCAELTVDGLKFEQ